jgi:hypothetical protein
VRHFILHMRRAGQVIAPPLNCGVRRQANVSGTFEGDLIRPLGLVTLYFAYAEGELDELLQALSVRDPFDDAKRQWPVGQKLRHAQQLLRGFGASELAALDSTLDEARVLFDRRNTIVHGRIYAGGRLVYNRPNAPKCVTPSELTELAELIFACKERIFAYRCKHLLPLLARLELTA